jgi:phosphoribosyl-dephospho-CoA transferase
VAQAFRPHDLLWLKPGAVFEDLPAWAGERLALGLPVVVRRAPRPGSRLPAGIRGEQRSQRQAIHLEPAWVARAMAPEDLLAVGPRADRADLPALRTLALLAGLLPALLPAGVTWGPTGSVGFERATGWPAVTAASDLDLLLRCPEPVSQVTARAWLEACSGLPARCDCQLETGAGGVALAEWARGRGEVLVRTDAGPLLTSEPWAMPAPVAP